MRHHIDRHCEPPQAARQSRKSRKSRKTLDCFATLAMTMLLLFTTNPAHAQSAGDACSTANQVVRVQGPAGAGLICNGTTLEVYEGVLTTPLRHGIGTATPAAKLDVNGEVKIGSTALACAAGTAGAVRYNSGSLEFCDGSAWNSTARNFAAGTVGSPGLFVTGDSNTGLWKSAADRLSISTGGVQAFQFNTAASGVNYLAATPAATAGSPTLGVEGSDTNISMKLTTKGSGFFILSGNSGILYTMTPPYYMTNNNLTGGLDLRDQSFNPMYFFGDKSAANNDLEIWSRNIMALATTSGNITMMPGGTGKVGVGTTSPQATLDVNGYIKLKTNAAQPVACTASDKGSIAYTSTTNYLCFCNGTAWNQVHAPSTACTW